jgi:hypothetical protein
LLADVDLEAPYHATPEREIGIFITRRQRAGKMERAMAAHTELIGKGEDVRSCELSEWTPHGTAQ